MHELLVDGLCSIVISDCVVSEHFIIFLDSNTCVSNKLLMYHICLVLYRKEKICFAIGISNKNTYCSVV